MEEDSRVFSETLTRRSGPSAGIIKWIKLENLMCHGSLPIEFRELNNFITGQNRKMGPDYRLFYALPKDCYCISSSLFASKQIHDYHKKVPVICPESEVHALGGCEECTSEQLSAQMTRLKSINELRMRYEKKECKFLRKQKTYQAFRKKLKACQKALDVRLNNCSILFGEDAAGLLAMLYVTQGLSSWERSFSMLCFALALHEMTKAPF
ncbi:hypothetical protein RJ641_033324 [Dillenia turbinata]|uniref:Uncharacterized protein n=1 Tax=Dillenia turbinata TaxID=194707 RepID=A0AAN8VM42_9MAGN